MADDKEFLRSIEEIDAALPSDAVSFGLGIDDICPIINKIKGPLQSALPIIELIPIYGKTVAGAIKLLLQLANSVCPK